MRPDGRTGMLRPSTKSVVRGWPPSRGGRGQTCTYRKQDPSEPDLRPDLHPGMVWATRRPPLEAFEAVILEPLSTEPRPRSRRIGPGR